MIRQLKKISLSQKRCSNHWLQGNAFSPDNYQYQFALSLALLNAGDKNDEFLQLGLVVHELAYKSKEIYELANVDEKRLLLSQLFTNFVQRERKIEPKLTSAAQFLGEWIPKLNQSYELQKQLKNSSIKGKKPAYADFHPIWLHIVDDVRTYWKESSSIFIPAMTADSVSVA